MPLKQNGSQVLSSYKGGTSVWVFLLLDYLWETFSPVNSSAIRLLTYVPVISSNGYTKESILYFTGLILQGIQAAKLIFRNAVELYKKYSRTSRKRPSKMRTLSGRVNLRKVVVHKNWTSRKCLDFMENNLLNAISELRYV